MNRRTTTILATALAALPLATAAPAPASAPDSGSTPSCRSMAPKNVTVSVSTGGKSGVVRWKIPSGHPDKLAYRVTRAAAVVGQTRETKLKVALAPSRATRIKVTAVLAGKPTRCTATAQVRGSGTKPGQVPGLMTTLRAGHRLKLSW